MCGAARAFLDLNGSGTYDSPGPSVRPAGRAAGGVESETMSVVASPAAVRQSVLVVDDSNLLRGILREELEAEGFEVHLAEDGPQALEMAHDLRPDVILLDI